MEDSLEEVTLTRIFAVEKFQKLKNKFLIDDLFADAWLEVRRLEETQKELVHELKIRQKSVIKNVILNNSHLHNFPYPKDKKIGRHRHPYLQVTLKS